MLKTINILLKSILILTFLVPLTGLKAQSIYSTVRGSVFIKGVINDSAFVARSNDLIINLDYETTEFSIKLDLSSLSTGIESLDKKIKSLKHRYIYYKGKLGLNTIITEKHPPLNFNVTGHILSDDDKYKSINGDGSLIHVFGDNFSCVLNLDFKFNWKETNLNIDIPGLNEVIQVKIMQSILERRSN